MKKIFLLLICLISFAVNAQSSNRYKYTTQFDSKEVGQTVNVDAADVLIVMEVNVPAKTIKMLISSGDGPATTFILHITAPVITTADGDKYLCYSDDSGINEKVDVMFFDNYSTCLMYSYQTKDGLYLSNHIPRVGEIR